MKAKTPLIKAGAGPPSDFDPDETLLTDAQVEKRWHAKDGYMGELRAQGKGPKHIRLSPRIVRYHPRVIKAYEQSREFASNAEAEAAGNAVSESETI